MVQDKKETLGTDRKCTMVKDLILVNNHQLQH